MSPIEEAAATLHASHDEFLAVLEDHLLNGVVISTPDCFLMAKREGDRWHIWDAVGDWSQALPYAGDATRVSWHHRGRYVEIPLSRAIRVCGSASHMKPAC